MGVRSTRIQATWWHSEVQTTWRTTVVGLKAIVRLRDNVAEAAMSSL